MQSEPFQPPSARRRWRITAVLLAAAVAVTWIVTGVLFNVVIPAMLTDTWSLAAPESAAAGTRVAAVIAAIVGILLLAATAAAAWPRTNLVARILLVVAGITSTLLGLLHATGGSSFMQHGPAMQSTAITMLVVSAALVAVGVFACAAGLSRLLPGQSLAERAIVEQPRRTTSRRRMLVPTLAVALIWAAIVGLFLATMWPGVEATAFPVAVFGAAVIVPPALAGALVGRWREAAPNRLSTLGLAAAGGVAADWLLIAVLWLWEVARFPGQDLASGSVDLDVPIVFAILGAFLGAAGYGLESLVGHRLERRRQHAG